MKKHIIVSSVIMLLVVVGLAIWMFCAGEAQIGVIFSLIGIAVSFGGIVVTLNQVSSAVEKTEEVRKEVQKSNNDIWEFNSYADFSRETEIVKSLLSDLPLKEYRSLQRRIVDVKSFLIRQKSNPRLANKNDLKSKIDASVLALGVDVKNLNQKITSKSFALDLEGITNHLSQVVDILESIRGQMENEKYGK